MAWSLPYSCVVARPCLRWYYSRGQAMKVRAQSYRDEGTSSNLVDASLSVLRERIEEVQVKERLERCCRCEQGWNYASGYDHQRLKRKTKLWELFELLALVVSTIGFTFIGGTAFLCLVSLVIHLNQ